MMSEGVFLTGLLSILATVVLVVVVWQGFATRRAKAALAREDEYRGLSARTVVAQESTDQRLEAFTTQLAEIQARLDSIERTLTVVE
jgi:hypothetical protein